MILARWAAGPTIAATSTTTAADTLTEEQDCDRTIEDGNSRTKNTTSTATTPTAATMSANSPQISSAGTPPGLAGAASAGTRGKRTLLAQLRGAVGVGLDDDMDVDEPYHAAQAHTHAHAGGGTASAANGNGGGVTGSLGKKARRSTRKNPKINNSKTTTPPSGPASASALGQLPAPLAAAPAQSGAGVALPSRAQSVTPQLEAPTSPAAATTTIIGDPNGPNAPSPLTPLSPLSPPRTLPATAPTTRPTSPVAAALDRTHGTRSQSNSQSSSSSSSSTNHQQHHHGRSHATSDSQDFAAAFSSANANRKAFVKAMEPPVLSFYGAEPIPLPSRFAQIKTKLIAGHEDAVEASWYRLLDALRVEIADIQDRGSELIPSINFTDIHDPVRVEAFAHKLKRYGVAVIRGVVKPSDAEAWVSETRDYLDKNREFKPPALHDPTCIDLFWTPVQVRARAHPNMLRAQKFAMSFWESTDDLHITRCPVSYADRLRIHNASLGAVGQPNGNSAADSLSASASATVIAQVDSGSLERWEPDGYGRGGTYESIFKGDWESYDAWDPAGRVGATTDLYNGAGVCSIFRMFQGILALTAVEQGMIRVLPSPKLVTAYFLLRPYFSPKRGPPEQPDGGKADQWAAYLDPSNWALNREQNTVIHGAVPGHAQRITERWHPHLHLRRSLVSIPSLQAGDYVIWHCDQAYSIITGGTRLGVPPPLQTPSSELSLLTYTPVCPLTQTNALFLARQRKAFLLGQPGPDFDTLGGMGSESSHQDRPGEKAIEEVGGVEGLRAMGLAPWDVEPAGATGQRQNDLMDIDGEEGNKSPTNREAEAELLRLANIILFPSRYDFYLPNPGTKGAGDRTPKHHAKAKGRTTVNGNRPRS